MALKFDAILESFEPLGERYAILRLKPIDESWRHNPGQYTEITFGEGSEAFSKIYSIASARRADGVLDFCIQLNDPQLIEAAATWEPHVTRLVIAPAAGSFFRPAYDSPAVLLAGGSGVTPLKAILEDRLLQKPSARTVLLYGCGDNLEIPFCDELRALAQRHPEALTLRIFAEHIIDSSSNPPQTEQGRPLTALGEYLAPGSHYLMCGPPPFMEAARAFLLAAQVAGDQIHQDRY